MHLVAWTASQEAPPALHGPEARACDAARCSAMRAAATASPGRHPTTCWGLRGPPTCWAVACMSQGGACMSPPPLSTEYSCKSVSHGQLGTIRGTRFSRGRRMAAGVPRGRAGLAGRSPSTNPKRCRTRVVCSQTAAAPKLFSALHDARTSGGWWLGPLAARPQLAPQATRPLAALAAAHKEYQRHMLSAGGWGSMADTSSVPIISSSPA